MMDYQYLKAYQYDNDLMKSYFDLTQRVFNFDLKEWRNAGYWDNNYIPHSLVYHDRIIANVSAAMLQLQIHGNNIKAIQLGSVGVLPEYRGMGLSRILTEKVLEEYKHFPLIFLFANHDVLNYYPKFGFKPVNQGIPFINVAHFVKKAKAIKITIESDHLKRLIYTKLQHSSILDGRGNPTFYWFHLLYNFNDSIYYIEEKDIIFLANYDHDAVDIFDILTENRIRFEDIQDYILEEGTKKVRFHFTPDWLGLNYNIDSYHGDVMHVLGEFPEDIVNFKFPVTGVT
ncbi:MAG: GNAT family N-acetyltransferase [Clostridia bacterium]|nr:GNAT family N-acetyltransferase [Clostridia bacterium]